MIFSFDDAMPEYPDRELLGEFALLQLGELLYSLTRIRPEPLQADALTDADEIEAYLTKELEALRIPFDHEFEDDIDVLIQEKIQLHGQPLILRVSVAPYLGGGVDRIDPALLYLTWRADLFRPDLTKMLEKMDCLLGERQELAWAERVFVVEHRLASLTWPDPFARFRLAEAVSQSA